MKKEIFVLGIGRALQVLLLFFNYRLLTEALPKNEVGQYFFILSLSAVVGLIFINPIGTYFNRTLHSFSSSKEVKKQMIVIFFIISFLATLNFPIIFLARHFFNSLESQWLLIASVVTIYVFTTSTNNTLVPTFNFFKQRYIFVALTVTSQAIALLLAYYLGATSQKSTYWILGHSFGFGIIAVLSLFVQPKVEKNTYSSNLPMKLLSNEGWKFAWPIAIVNIAVWSMTQGYRPFLEKVQGLEVLAEVGLGLGLASALSVAFEYLVQQIYQPDFYKESHVDSANAWNQLAIKSISHYLQFSFFLFVLAPFAIIILADTSYKESYVYLQLGAIVEFFRMLTNLMALKAHGDLKTERLQLPYLFAVSVLIIGLYFVPQLSFRGEYLVFSLMISYMVLFLSVKKSNQIQLRHILKSLWSTEMKAFTVFILVLFIPRSLTSDKWLSAILCVVFGLLFLGIQYRQVIRFESEGDV